MSFRGDARAGNGGAEFELHISRKHPSQEAAAFWNARRNETALSGAFARTSGLPFVFISLQSGDSDDGRGMAMPLYETCRKLHRRRRASRSMPVRSRSADKLDISEGAPIRAQTLRARHDDKPVEYNIGYYRADGFTCSISLQRLTGPTRRLNPAVATETAGCGSAVPADSG